MMVTYNGMIMTFVSPLLICTIIILVRENPINNLHNRILNIIVTVSASLPQRCLIYEPFSSDNSASTATPHSRLGSSGLEPLDHILTWPSLNSQSSQKLLRLICCSSGLLRPCQNVSYAQTLDAIIKHFNLFIIA